MMGRGGDWPSMMAETRTVAFGFINDLEIACNETVGFHVQRPFRGRWLWLWGDGNALLHALYVGGEQQLVSPVRFCDWPPPIVPSDFLRLCAAGSEQPPPTRRLLQGEQVYEAFARQLANRQPYLVLPAQAPGTALSFRVDGKVRGVVLVGSEVA